MLKVHSFTVLPVLPEPLRKLEEIARNLYWTWNPEFVELFKRVDNNLWTASGHNPVKLLSMVSQERLEHLAENQGFLCEIERASEKLRLYLGAPRWFDGLCSEQDKPLVAYFSAEFGLHECLPIYAGGLGILAGDHLKSASDLGINLVGVGLLYQKGYFRQYLNIDGWQQEMYIENDFASMPVELVRKRSGKPLTISVEFPGRCVRAQIWRVKVGRVKLYLLDTNIAANSSTDRLITANLYGGDREMRICQEIMLGIGGYKALTAMDIRPAVCHMNEGHAAFMALERIRQLQNENKLGFYEAAEAARAGNVFTIHTLVKAGLDEFSTPMMDKYFGGYFSNLGINRKQFLSLGRIDPNDENESFKMPILAIRLSGCRNGVSRLHTELSRQMWSCLWLGVPVDEVPIKAITNGIHVKSWLSGEMNGLYERYFGANWADDVEGNWPWEDIGQVPDEEFWRTHQRSKEQMVGFARKRLRAQLQRRGTYHSELNWADEVLDPEVLTIGFARRFAGYKRGNLLLKDPRRLTKLLTNPEQPVQIIFAGKAHPTDKEGKEIIRQIIHFAGGRNVRRRIVFLEDYDVNIAKVLLRGVDLWLNNPRRPMEACGTSGMKAVVNGALNISTLDGWWCEGYDNQVGWAIGGGEVYEDGAYQDMVESQALYNILENEVVPLFYARAADGLPRAWINRVKSSIKLLGPRFSAHRMVAEYGRQVYLSAASRWRELTAENCAKSKALSVWKNTVRSAWSEFSVDDVQVAVQNGDGFEPLDPKQSQVMAGLHVSVRALVTLGAARPQDVSVEVYYGPVDAWGHIKQGSAMRMQYQQAEEADGQHWFTGTLSCTSAGRKGLAVRVLPRNDDLVDPYEPGLILWEQATAGKGVAVS